jgi:hypothetical protein
VIVDAFFDLVLGVLEFALGLLPTWDPPLFDFGDEALSLGDAFGLGGKWVEVDFVATCVAAIGLLLPVAAAVRLSLWVYEKLPGKMT